MSAPAQNILSAEKISRRAAQRLPGEILGGFGPRIPARETAQAMRPRPQEGNEA